MQNGPTETSVLISLRELVALEDERLQEEEEARQAAEQAAEQARREAIEQARAAEEARRLAEEEERRARAQQHAEEEARLAAIAQAELERARIEAEAQAAQAARQTELEHQRALAHHDQERQKARLKMWGVGVVLAAVLGAGAIGTFAFYPTDTTTDPRIAQLEAERQDLLRERLAALDGLRSRLDEKIAALEEPGAALDRAKSSVAEAREAIDSASLSDGDIERYHEALEQLATAIGRAHRAARLDKLNQLHDELDARVERMRHPSSALKKARKVAASRRKAVDAAEPVGRDLDAYDDALDRLALALGDEPSGSIGRPGPRPSTGATGDTGDTGPVCDFHDPLCARLPD
jgi:colicin import membrane protein